MSNKAKSGDKVSVHYTGKLENGEIFDSSKMCMNRQHNHGECCGAHDHDHEHHHHEKEPLTFVIGGGQVIKGFENGVIDMEIGENKEVKIMPENAYGMPREDMIIDFDKNQFPEDMNPEVGMMVELNDEAGHVIPAAIIEVSEDKVKIDANHPLAGKTLIFELELVDIL